MAATHNITNTAPLVHSMDEARSILGIGRTLMFDLAKDGRISTVKIGKRRLVPHSAIEEFLVRLAKQSAA